MFENLSKREKNMAIVVACLLPVVVVFFGWTSISSNLKLKNNAIITLTQELSDLQLEQVKGELATERLASYREESLPTNTQKSVTQYQLWLQELVESTGMEGFAIKIKNRNAPQTIIGFENKPVSNIYRIEITKATCTVRQLVDLLFRFQQAKLLQRINEFVARPVVSGSGTSSRPTGKLIIERINIEVVCLPGSDETRLFETEQREETERSLDEYYNIVASRDVFGLPNEKPSLGVDGSQEFEVGRNVRVDLEGRDENGGQELTYTISDLKWELKDENETFDASKFVLTDGEVELGRIPEGDYSFLAKVTDNGWPNKSDEKRVRIEVYEEEVAPPEPARMEASDSYISGKTTKDGKIAQIWIRINPQDKLLMLVEGESFDLDDQKWTIDKIEEDTVLIDRAGEQLKFRIGSSLGKPESAAKAADSLDQEKTANSL